MLALARYPIRGPLYAGPGLPRLTVRVQGGELRLICDGSMVDLQGWHLYPDGVALMQGRVKLNVQDVRVTLYVLRCVLWSLDRATITPRAPNSPADEAQGATGIQRFGRVAFWANPLGNLAMASWVTAIRLRLQLFARIVQQTEEALRRSRQGQGSAEPTAHFSSPVLEHVVHYERELVTCQNVPLVPSVVPRMRNHLSRVAQVVAW